MKDLDESAKELGLKRRFLESNPQLARRVMHEYVRRAPVSWLLGDNETQRVCFDERAAYFPDEGVKQWTFYYSDGTTEVLTAPNTPAKPRGCL
jgi:hypothetical protein